MERKKKYGREVTDIVGSLYLAGYAWVREVGTYLASQSRYMYLRHDSPGPKQKGRHRE